MVKNKLLILMLIVCFLLRLYNAGSLSGGDDSSFAKWLFYAMDEPSRFIYMDLPDLADGSPGPAYLRNFSIWPPAFFVYLFGFNALALRMASLLFAPLSAFVLYKLCERHLGKKEAMLATFLFVFSPLNIAFTRFALLESALTFYILSIMYLITLGIDNNKKLPIYISGGILFINLLSTNYRGAVPLVGLLAYAILKKHRMWPHLIATGIISIGAYFIYPFIPLLWGQSKFVDTLLHRFVHASGEMGTTLLQSLWEQGSYLFFTPFLGLLIVPAIFGLIKCKKLRPFNAMIIVGIASSILFYMQGQPYPARHTIYVPLFAILAAIGIVKTENKTRMWLLTFSYYGVMALVLLTLIPEGISLSKILGSFLPVFLLLISIASIALFLLSFFIRGYRKISFFLFLTVNILVPVALVTGGIGIYKKQDTIDDVADYIRANLGDEKWGCVSGTHYKSLVFLLQRDCAAFYHIDSEWLQENAEKGNLRYFVINKYYPDGTHGLGRFNPDGSVDTSNNSTHERFMNHYDKIDWIFENTVDITEQAIGENPHFIIREIK